jgi:hypothetical protein
MKNFARNIDLNYIKRESIESKSFRLDTSWPKIRTFEEAAHRIGVDPSSVPDVSGLPDKYRKSVIAFYKLLIIYRVVNEKWIPNYKDETQLKFFAVFKQNGDILILGNNSFPYSGSICCGSKDRAVYLLDIFRDLHIDFWMLSADSFPKIDK